MEAELDVPDGFFDDEEVATLAELRPEGETGLVLARRVFGDGRTRAYAWGRAVAREDVAAAAERLISMSTSSSSADSRAHPSSSTCWMRSAAPSRSRVAGTPASRGESLRPRADGTTS